LPVGKAEITIPGVEARARSKNVADALERLGRGDCVGAFAALEPLAEGELGALGMETLAQAAWLCGDLDACLRAYERAFRAYLAEGNARRAGFVALMLSWEYGGRLARSVADGWLRRAERLLESEGDSAEFGYLMWYRSRGHLADKRALDQLDLALELAQRHGDQDLAALAQWYRGFAQIQSGALEKGFRLIDEAMAEATGGGVSSFVAGFIYCITVTSCRELGDYRRAAEWTESQRRWCEQTKVAIFPSVCRVNRACILSKRGACTEAEHEALRACEELERTGPIVSFAEALYELGDLRLRQNYLEVADELFAHAYELGWSPLPGLARLRLLQGRLEEARALLDDAIEAQSADPMAEARYLPDLVEVALAQNDAPRAREAATRLEEVARILPLAAQAATSESAWGAVLLAEGAAPAAIEHFRRALRLWRDDVEAPFEAASTQLALAGALRTVGHHATAIVEARAALATFTRLAATREEAIAGRVLRALELAEDAKPPEVARRTFLFTDIVDSTRLLDAMGDRAWHRLLDWHDALLRSLFEANDGEEIDHAGDGFFVAFDDPAAAIGCAVAIQRALAENRRSSGYAPEVRIGVHAADATQHAAGYRGKGVHAAARLGGAAGASEILATRETVELNELQIRWVPRGDLQPKGFAQPVEVVSVDWQRGLDATD
jgi:class 3 adenylate cyclase